MIEVWHNPNFILDGYKEDGITQVPPNCVKVAHVTGNNLDVAFKKTNNIDEEWVFNYGVTYCGPTPDGCRSTSMGDVMRRGDEWFLVAGVGFKKIESK